MEPTSKTYLERLTPDGVSIVTERHAVVDGREITIGQPHRAAYANSPQGRKSLQAGQPEDIVAAVLALWGSAPTVEDPKPMGGVK
jgi:hypothetical protein